MSATHNSNVMSEFRDYVVISSWTNTVSPAMQDMLRLTTNGTDFMQEFLSTENQYRTALSVLSSAGATRDATLPELSDEEKQRVIEIARTMVVDDKETFAVGGPALHRSREQPRLGVRGGVDGDCRVAGVDLQVLVLIK